MLKPLKSWPVAAALMFVSASALAEQGGQHYPECTREPGEAEVKAAKGAFQAGQVAFDEGDYERAITYWEDAYRRDCTKHVMLLNLARVYELADRKEQAIIALETYLERDPEAGKSGVINRRIQVLRDKIAKEQKPAEPPPPAPEPAAAPPPPPPVQVLPPPPPAEEPGGRPLAPLIVAGTGGVVFAVGGILYLSAASDVRTWEDRCPDRNCAGVYADNVDDANSARTRQTVSGVVSLVGLGVGVGGVAWYFASSPGPSETSQPHGTAPRPRLTPAVGPGYAGLQLAGSF
jgi:tetratricopeptide (TPR) repeat protein